jgi:hypothetical protein
MATSRQNPFHSQYLLDCYVRYTVRIALKSSVDAAD